MAEETVNIVRLFGGLGNQMFQYAFWCSLCSRYPENRHFIDLTYLNTYYAHSGYELDRIFAVGRDIELPLSYKEWIQRLPVGQVEDVQEQGASFFQQVTDTRCPVRFFTGYWQTELYFKDIEKDIRTAFRFREQLLSEKTRKMAEEIRKHPSVSIHIRRQDYLLPNSVRLYGNICTSEYYEVALEMLREQLSSDELYIYLFSDDPEWVKENVQYENSQVIDWNHKEDSWQDMYLISVCRYHIVANSSFSWWGAWLDERKDKIVIAPGVWLNTRLAPDILPETWQYPFSMEKRWIDIVHHHVTSIPLKGLFHGQMGLIVFFYHYGIIKNVSYRQTAERLLDSLMCLMVANITDNYSEGLAGIGTAVEYLLQNGFVEGNADEILSEVDRRLIASVSLVSEGEWDLATGLCGWLRYFRFRLRKSSIVDELIYLLNKETLFYGLCCLKKVTNISESVVDEIVSELGKIGSIGLYPKTVELLLRSFLQDSKSNYGVLIRKAEVVNEKRINTIIMDRSFGLHGFAGKELKFFSVQSLIPWTELI